MLKYLKVLWGAFYVAGLLALIASVVSTFIATGRIFPSNILSIAFPYLFASLLAASVFNAFIFKNGWLLIVFVILISLYNLSHLIALRYKKDFVRQKSESALRVLTWNIDRLRLSTKHAVPNKVNDYKKVISDYQPDVICMQEHLHRNSFVLYMKENGYPYVYDDSDHIIMFSKLPFSDTLCVSFDNAGAPRTMLSATVMFEGRKVRINTFHLLSYRIPKHGKAFVNESQLKYTLKRLLTVSRSQVRQIKMYKQITQVSQEPQIICGDFNSVPSSYIYNVARKGLQDTYLKGAKGLGVTFPNFLRTLRIDYILADKRFKVHQSTVIKTYASDHFPVVTDMSL